MTSGDLKKLQQDVTLLRAEGKYKEAIENGLELLQSGLAAEDYKSALVAHLNIAASYYCIGDIKSAFGNIGEFQEICRSHGDQEDYLNLYNVLFLLYEFNRDYVQAKNTLVKSRELAMSLKKFNIASNAYSNMSHVLIEEGKYEEALEMANEGLRMAMLYEPESPLLKFRVMLNKAKALILLKKMDESKKVILEMDDASLLQSNIREHVQFNMLKGEWASANEEYDKAISCFCQAKTLVEQYGDRHLLQTILKELTNLCERISDFNRGFMFQKEYIAVLALVTEEKLSQTALKLDIKHKLSETEKRANTDYLTGLSNRDYMERITDEWLQTSLENVVCIVFDLDDFKLINDRYGHLFGDEVIRNVATSCNALISENEVFGRYGGDEFVILMKDVPLEKGLEKAEKIRGMLYHLLDDKAGTELHIGMSAGVAESGYGNIKTFNELFHKADLALYRAKGQGKNIVNV